MKSPPIRVTVAKIVILPAIVGCGCQIRPQFIGASLALLNFGTHARRRVAIQPEFIRKRMTTRHAVALYIPFSHLGL